MREGDATEMRTSARWRRAAAAVVVVVAVVVVMNRQELGLRQSSQPPTESCQTATGP